MMRYEKPPLTFDDQLELLRRRGLAMPDPDRVRRWLEKISYYRLSAYFLPFKADGSFTSGTTFEDVADLYVFDRKLRLLVLDALERVEIAVRTGVTYQLAHAYGPFGYSDASHFDERYSHSQLMRDLEVEERRAGETFVAHFRAKYTGEGDLPVWMATELMSFGAISMMYKHMAPTLKSAISQPYSINDAMFARWLHSLSYLRNVCAHHKRLWNREFAIRPQLPTRSHRPELAWAVTVPDTGRLYCALSMLQHMLRVISPQSTWKERLARLLADHPRIPLVPMGFDPAWRTRPLWA